MMFSNDSLIHTMNQIIDEVIIGPMGIPFNYEYFMSNLGEDGKPIFVKCPYCHKSMFYKVLKKHRHTCDKMKVYET